MTPGWLPKEPLRRLPSPNIFVGVGLVEPHGAILVRVPHPRCPLMALRRHSRGAVQCPIQLRTSARRPIMSGSSLLCLSPRRVSRAALLAQPALRQRLRSRLREQEPESPLWVILRQWRIQLLRAMASISRAKLVIRRFRPICLIVARRTLGADGKTTVPTPCTAPSPNQYASTPFNGCVVRRLPACDLPKRHYHERYLQFASCRRRSAQKLSRNDEPRRLCARSNAEL